MSALGLRPKFATPPPARLLLPRKPPLALRLRVSHRPMSALADPRRHVLGVFGRHGHDGSGSLSAPSEALTASLPRVRLLDRDGGEKEWGSQANTYLAGASTRRVRARLCQIRVEGNTGGGPPGG